MRVRGVHAISYRFEAKLTCHNVHKEQKVFDLHI